ncbi:hypothetical protein C7453_102384 [Gluconacetobacter liquefaciens]|uniref:Uncharacterized protein n=1 Tax=Gluconacetobacter liquefaciens TaxID=89584 RepID=A0A370G8R0_GLULI|nr:hypothetical protein C7453_102384 [Gluconacetobacter liquefaciens]
MLQIFAIPKLHDEPGDCRAVNTDNGITQSEQRCGCIVKNNIIVEKQQYIVLCLKSNRVVAIRKLIAKITHNHTCMLRCTFVVSIQNSRLPRAGVSNQYLQGQSALGEYIPRVHQGVDLRQDQFRLIPIQNHDR